MNDLDHEQIRPKNEQLKALHSQDRESEQSKRITQREIELSFQTNRNDE
jgi:hypothetical protein